MVYSSIHLKDLWSELRLRVDCVFLKSIFFFSPVDEISPPYQERWGPGSPESRSDGRPPHSSTSVEKHTQPQKQKEKEKRHKMSFKTELSGLVYLIFTNVLNNGWGEFQQHQQICQPVRRQPGKEPASFWSKWDAQVGHGAHTQIEWKKRSLDDRSHRRSSSSVSDFTISSPNTHRHTWTRVAGGWSLLKPLSADDAPRYGAFLAHVCTESHPQASE